MEKFQICAHFRNGKFEFSMKLNGGLVIMNVVSQYILREDRFEIEVKDNDVSYMDEYYIQIWMAHMSQTELMTVIYLDTCIFVVCNTITESRKLKNTRLIVCIIFILIFTNDIGLKSNSSANINDTTNFLYLESVSNLGTTICTYICLFSLKYTYRVCMLDSGSVSRSFSISHDLETTYALFEQYNTLLESSMFNFLTSYLYVIYIFSIIFFKGQITIWDPGISIWIYFLTKWYNF